MDTSPLILVIDDDTSVARFIAFKLKKKGYRVQHIDNGSDGLEAIRIQKPDLVILDMMMPGIDGREVAEKVKGQSIIDPKRIIILSGKEMANEIKALFDLGIHDYLQKPFNIDNLMIRIDRALSSLPPQ